ncbi:bifunctional metallophosphatase/5'-nucleotidase [Mycoplasmopsis cricetuli]|uniref:bifunctional metallophosphatase/5'-nucleotidase n=1 Tax=Mycoplasmopsis cricetuli TaxID=171283 RepID=UPI000470766B|nr:5'-nucleotidase C-terminal domain-containing protein [Mycoplasmopsis cricetuli]
MKKLKWFNLLLTSGLSAVTLPLVASSCNQTATLNEQNSQKRKEYFNSLKEYNIKIKELATKFENNTKSLEKAQKLKDEAQIKKAYQDLYDIYFESKFTLNKMTKQLNFLHSYLNKNEQNDTFKTIKIFHTNDEHGRLLYDNSKFSKYSGLEGLNKFIERYDYDLLLSSGDLIQGLPLSDSDKGKTITNIAKFNGYDSIAVGNHEFDYGLNHILELNKKSSESKNGREMPFISANIYYQEFKDNEIKPEGYDSTKVNQRVFKPYIIKKLDNNLKVAILGITTPDTKYTSHPSNSTLVYFKDPATSAKETIDEIKKAEPNIDLIIATVHLGTGRSKVEWTSEYLAKNTDNKIDLILDGHSHTYVKLKQVNDSKSYVTQTESYTKYLGDISLVYNTKEKKIEQIEDNLRDINEISVGIFDANRLLIGELEKIFNKENKVVVFKSPGEFIHVENQVIDKTPYWVGRIKPTALGSFVSNALAWDFVKNTPWVSQKNWEPGTLDNTIGLTNGGGIRTDLKQGDITRADILGLSPFGNRISGVRVKGNTLLETLKYGASKGRSGGFAQLSSNVSYLINVVKKTDPKTNEPGWLWELDTNSVKINGKSIDPEKYYYIITNDFILVGGDGYTILDISQPDKNSAVQLAYEGSKWIDSLINYGQIYGKESLTEEEKNKYFGIQLNKYLEQDFLKNQIVNIPSEAIGEPIPKP